MSKNCFLLAPLIKFNLLTETINLCQRFKKRLRHLAVVEVEVFTIILCAQSLEDAQYMQLRLLRNIIYKNCLYMHTLKSNCNLLIQRATPSQRERQKFDSGADEEVFAWSLCSIHARLLRDVISKN